MVYCFSSILDYILLSIASLQFLLFFLLFSFFPFNVTLFQMNEIKETCNKNSDFQIQFPINVFFSLVIYIYIYENKQENYNKNGYKNIAILFSLIYFTKLSLFSFLDKIFKFSSPQKKRIDSHPIYPLVDRKPSDPGHFWSHFSSAIYLQRAKVTGRKLRRRGGGGGRNMMKKRGKVFSLTD